ncbi:S8 family serine peptidase [Streptomyces sp. NPDC014894]|uniref:S8 family serine peptidase n=1 Tax=Streptomyces sp. NPDC014894 TaxID=3364931 RepID=UPI0036F5EDFB
MNKACVTTIAAAAAVALTAGMTGPASAIEERADQQASAYAAAAQGKTGPGRGEHRVALITGDHVLVDDKGRVTGLKRAKGREDIPVQTRTVDGHTYVIPADAARLISEGKLDRRLFDVTELSKAESRKAYRDGLKVIVSYRGASAQAAKAEVRSAGDTQVRRTLKTLNADAVTTPGQDATELWEALTRPGDGGARAAAAGISSVWLDGVRRAHLDKSVAQIGTPAAWTAGYKGKGVKIAVLDTGVDDTHPDLKDQVIGAANFTSSPDTKDRYGHGTHVASIAAGTGVKSGKHKGVAPEAKVLSGKVLNDYGSGDDSGIIAGIDWAVAQGADVINMSLGGMDTPEVDPLEAHVNKVTAEKGVLFAISSGNDGPGAGTVGSPGSADSALTVGAVDDKNKLADFSSIGPRVGDGAIKPDVTAPGVDTTAASAKDSLIAGQVGEKPAGYLTISGTSMAAPHAAGAAALLKQQHPTWKPEQIKGALTGSAKDGKYSAFQQGSGRIAVDQAIKQTVIAEPVSVSFGVQQWPHTDDKPVTKDVTYRNLGDKDVTLSLTASALDPKGKPAPAGFFTLGAKTVTVPAGGTASVRLTADTRLGGTVDGAYSATVVATGGGQTVRTAAAVDREVESYDLTVTHIGRDGKPSADARSSIFGSGASGARWYDLQDPSGVQTVRVPKGEYILEGLAAIDPQDWSKGLDLVIQPKLNITKKTAVTVDARTAKPVDVKVPNAKAKTSYAMFEFTKLFSNGGGLSSGYFLNSFSDVNTTHLGPEVTDGSLTQAWAGQWTTGDSEYNTLSGGTVKKIPAGHVKHYKTGELAKIKAGLGASSKDKGKKAELLVWGRLHKDGGSVASSVPVNVPGNRTVYVSTNSNSNWELDYRQIQGEDEDGWPVYASGHTTVPKKYAAGKSYEVKFNTGVHGPVVGKDVGVFRKGNELVGSVPVFGDGSGHYGWSDYSSVKTTLHRGKTKVGQHDDPLYGEKAFKVGAADAGYTLATSVKRDAKIGKAASRIDANWTFRSKKPAGNKTSQVQLSTARFGAQVGLDSTVAAGKTQSVPVIVQGPAAGKGLKSLTVQVSYDQGKSWKKVSVKKGKVSLKNPAKGKGISLRADVTDTKGNKSHVTVYNAYLGK